ncbi:MAG: dTDP-glucose 4,6-dehydratase [Gammaproteobacteria bacterium]|nr:dTDP-glucose 4,6-dehydratase [Gammaproteobacteria bacterium]
MRHLLITGGAGFIGSNFVEYWLNRYPEDKVIVLDALTYAGSLANLKEVVDHPNYHFVHGDISDSALLEKLFSEFEINTVVHFAAESHVDRSIVGPDAFIQTNITGTFTLLNAARYAWRNSIKCNRLPRFHHVSTDEVYGALQQDEAAFTEFSPYDPHSPYAASKAASDHLVRAYGHTYGLPVTLSHCSNNYGPRQHAEKFIPTVVRSCATGQLIPIYGNGSNIRDWLHVHDHCVALELILNQGQVGETYNIGGECEWSNLKLARAICRILDVAFPKEDYSYESLLSFVPDRPGHDWRYAIDSTKLKRELGFVPSIEFEHGLRDTVCQYWEHLRFDGFSTPHLELEALQA